jgi:DtxR family Mn-dependent transcriptional regulator
MGNLPGIIALAVCVLLVATFWPRYGLFWWWQRYRQLADRVLAEDALKHFRNCEDLQLAATVDSLSGALQITRTRAAQLIAHLDDLGLVEPADAYWQLTSRGREYALRMVRAHRLLEVYLAEKTGLDQTHWHGEADRREHFLTNEEMDALAADMGDPRYDPHGDPIPTASGEVAPARGVPLTTLPAGVAAVVTHVEDEPEAVYEQLTAQGFSVGSRLQIIESTPQRIRVESEGIEQVFAPIVAANLSVVTMDEAELPPPCLKRLAEISPGHRVRVVRIAPACHGAQRRRLFDLGLIPGTIVRAEFRGPGGDPTAYDIRGATIALRRQQAEQILVASEDSQPQASTEVSSQAG